MRTLFIIFLSVIASIAATGLYFKNQNNAVTTPQKETTYDRVMRTGVIRCGYGLSPPALSKDPNTGKLYGLNYDLMNDLGKELGLKIEWAEEVGWGTFVEGLRTNRYDMFCSLLWPDAGRVKNLTLVGPVIYSKLYAYTRTGDTRFDGNLNRINAPDISLPVLDGDISYSMADNSFPNAKKLTLPQMATVSDMIESVATRKADVFFFDEAMMSAIPEEQRAKFKKVENTDPAFIFGSYFAFDRHQEGLRDMIEIVLDKMTDDGRLAKLARRYDPNYMTPARHYQE